MANVLIHRANELKPETRAAVEAELGRALADDEDVSIMAFALHDAPVGPARDVARERLKAHFGKIDGKRAHLSDTDAEQALGEAFRAVRPAYRERE
jgi:hypothetical protein